MIRESIVTQTHNRTVTSIMTHHHQQDHRRSSGYSKNSQNSRNSQNQSSLRHSHESELALITSGIPEAVAEVKEQNAHHRHSNEREEDLATLAHEEALENGLNAEGNCFCLPWWFCCFDRCMTPRNAVSAVGFFDGILNLFLCGMATFVILLYQLHSKHVQDRDLLYEGKRKKFIELMEENEDGLILLAASYGIMFPVSWNLSHNVQKLRRWDGVLWMGMAVYATSLQVVALVYFPFTYNLWVNIPLCLFRLYEFWVVFKMDRLKRALMLRAHTNELRRVRRP